MVKQLFEKFKTHFATANIPLKNQIPVSVSAYMKLSCAYQKFEDEALMKIWNTVLLREFQAMDAFQAQEPPTTLETIREWMGNSNHTQFLNQITELTIFQKGIHVCPKEIGNLHFLRTLDLSHNKLEILPEELFLKCPNLKRLDLSNNELDIIPERLLLGCPNLEKLDLHNNALEIIPEGLLLRCPNLEELDLDNNALKIIPERLLMECFSLEIFSFNDNELKTIPEKLLLGCSNLKALDLSKNLLETIPEKLLLGCSNLEALDLRNNLLKTIPERFLLTCPNLKELLLNNNELKTIPERFFLGCPNLETLNLNCNKLETISENFFLGCPKLLELCLCENGMKTIPFKLFQNFSCIEEINLCHNKFQTLPDALYYPRLIRLGLSNNELQALPEDFFENQPYLQDLDLSNNKLQIFPKNLFENCPDLTDLDFSENALQALPENLFKNCPNPLKDGIKLNGNPLQIIPEHAYLIEEFYNIYGTSLRLTGILTDFRAVPIRLAGTLVGFKTTPPMKEILIDTLNYACISTFAKFYQNLTRGFSSTKAMMEEFSKLDQQLKRLIEDQIDPLTKHKYLSRELDLNQSCHLELLDLHFCEAVQKVVVAKFRSSFGYQEGLICERLGKLANKPVHPLHLACNIPRLIDAMDPDAMKQFEAKSLEEFVSTLLKPHQAYVAEENSKKRKAEKITE